MSEPRKLRVGKWVLQHHVLKPSPCLLQTHCNLLLSAGATPDPITLHLTGHLPTTNPPSTTPVASITLHRAVLIAAGGPLRALVSGPFRESGAREITLHERANTFEVVARFLSCQPIVMSDAPRDLPLVADRWGLSDLFEAVFKHAEERVHAHGDMPAIPAWRLVEQFVPIMTVVDVPDRFKKYLAMRVALEMKEINEAFRESRAKVDVLEDECCQGCGEGVACRRRKKERKGDEPGGEVRNPSVKSLTYVPPTAGEEAAPAAEEGSDAAAPVTEGETAPAVESHIASAIATDAEDGEAGTAGDGTQSPLLPANADVDETQVAIVETQPAADESQPTAAESQTVSEPQPAVTEAESESGNSQITAAEEALVAAPSQLSAALVTSEGNGIVPEPTPEAETNSLGEAIDAEGSAVAAPSGEGDVVEGGTTEAIGSTEEAAENLNLSEGSVEEDAADNDIVSPNDADAGEAASVDNDAQLIAESVDTPPPTIEELRQPWHEEFDIWKLFHQRKMMKYVVHYMSHYGNLDYTIFLLDVVLRELEPVLSNEEAIKLLREIDWDWEGPSQEALRCPASEKWSARAWQLIAFAQNGFEGTGSDIRLSWKYNGLKNDIVERAKQLANKNESEANSTDSSDDESETGFSVKWDRRSGSNGLEFSLSLSCSDLDPESPDSLYLNVRLLEREDIPLDKQNGKREVTLRIKVIESRCGCDIGDEDGYQGFTASPTRNGGGKCTELSSFRKNGVRYQIFGSQELVAWMRRHTLQCGLLFHVRVYVLPLDADEKEEDKDEQNEEAEECTCGFCGCDEC